MSVFPKLIFSLSNLHHSQKPLTLKILSKDGLKRLENLYGNLKSVMATCVLNKVDYIFPWF